MCQPTARGEGIDVRFSTIGNPKRNSKRQQITGVCYFFIGFKPAYPGHRARGQSMGLTVTNAGEGRPDVRAGHQTKPGKCAPAWSYPIHCLASERGKGGNSKRQKSAGACYFFHWNKTRHIPGTGQGGSHQVPSCQRSGNPTRSLTAGTEPSRRKAPRLRSTRSLPNI